MDSYTNDWLVLANQHKTCINQLWAYPGYTLEKLRNAETDKDGKRVSRNPVLSTDLDDDDGNDDDHYMPNKTSAKKKNSYEFN